MATNEDKSGGTLGWLRNKRVLLAEDNITNQMVATQMLDALGSRVDVANDGAEAIDMLETHSYDLYLIDIEMPRVSGLDVIRKIRGAEPPLCDAPVIAVTAYALREHREKIADAGADGLIPKPLIGIEQFGRDIMSFIDRNRRRTEGASGGSNGSDGASGKGASGGAPVSASVFEALAEAIGEDAMADLLTKIDSDLEKAEKDVLRGVDESDKSALSGATHVLISVAGAVGAQNLQRAAQRMNAAANGRTEDDLGSLGADLAMQIKVLRAFVSSRVAGGAA